MSHLTKGQHEQAAALRLAKADNEMARAEAMKKMKDKNLGVEY